jgi:hypothetical protein
MFSSLPVGVGGSEVGASWYLCDGLGVSWYAGVGSSRYGAYAGAWWGSAGSGFMVDELCVKDVEGAVW